MSMQRIKTVLRGRGMPIVMNWKDEGDVERSNANQEEGKDLGNVGGERVGDRLLQVVEDDAAC